MWLTDIDVFLCGKSNLFDLKSNCYNFLCATLSIYKGEDFTYFFKSVFQQS